MKKKEIILLVGIPNSGKSTFTNEYLSKNDWSRSISRDTIRALHFGVDYKFDYNTEEIITVYYNELLERYLSNNTGFAKYTTIILDNTHIRERYIDEIIETYGKSFDIKIKFFDCSLTKAHIRNVIRYFKTGKWIPLKVINNMEKSYWKINRMKYVKYII